MDEEPGLYTGVLNAAAEGPYQEQEMTPFSSVDPVLKLSASKEVSDKRVKEHVLAWRATKLDKPQKLAGTVCKPLESPNNGGRGTRATGLVVAKE